MLFCLELYGGGEEGRIKCTRGKLSRFLEMVGGALFLGHSLVIIKWNWEFFSQNLQFDLPPTIRHKRVQCVLEYLRRIIYIIKQKILKFLRKHYQGYCVIFVTTSDIFSWNISTKKSSRFCLNLTEQCVSVVIIGKTL